MSEGPIAPAPPDPEKIKQLLPTREQMERMSEADLLKILDLSGSLSDIVLNMAADAWRVLEAKGVDLSQRLRHAKYRRVRDVANGNLAAEAIMRFGTDSRVLRYVSALGIGEQKKLAAGEPVKIVSTDAHNKPVINAATGEPDYVKQRVEDLDASVLDLVIDREKGVIRTPEQQAARIALPAPVHPEADNPPKIRIYRGKISIQGEVPVSELVQVLRDRGILS